MKSWMGWGKNKQKKLTTYVPYLSRKVGWVGERRRKNKTAKLTAYVPYLSRKVGWVGENKKLTAYVPYLSVVFSHRLQPTTVVS